MPAPTRRAAFAALLASASLLGLSACGNSDPNAFAPTCAKVGILADAADYSLYQGDVPDLGHLISQGSITGLHGHCRNSDDGHALKTTITTDMTVSRGPATTAPGITVPYFVAVLKNGELIWKHAATAIANFPPNVESVRVTSDPVYLDLPVGRGVSGDNYRLEVGFQLTPAQLDYNRTHPHG